MSVIDQAVEKLQADYPTVVNTLEAFDLVENGGQRIPSFESVAFHLTPKDADFLTRRAEAGIDDRLIIAPNIGALTLEMLLKKTGHYIVDNGYYNGRFEEFHKPKYQNRRETAPAWSIAVALNDTHGPKGTRLGHTGLVYPGHSFERQKTLAALERRNLRTRQGIDVQPITVQEQVIGQMTYPRQRGGTTRLIHLPTPNVFLPRDGKGPGPLGMLLSIGGHPGAPEITGPRIDFTTSSFHKKDPEAGVRRVLLLNGVKELNVLGSILRSLPQLPPGNPQLSAAS